MGKSKNKIIFNLTIDDLRELGIIGCHPTDEDAVGKKRRKGRKGHQREDQHSCSASRSGASKSHTRASRRNKKRILLIDPQTRAIIGGSKSDSSHMIGSTQSLQPSNTNNVNTAIQQANLEAIENANKRAKDQKQWLIDNGIDPNDPTIGIQLQERFPDRNTTKLLEGFGASVSDQLGQLKSQYDNQLLGYQDRFANYDKTINRGMEFVQQQQNQIEELKKKPFTYRLDDSAGAFGGTKGSDSFKSNNTSKSMNQINNTPASPVLRMQTPTRFTPVKKPESPLIEVIENKIPLKSNEEVYHEEVNKHINDVNYTEPTETLDQRLDRDFQQAQEDEDEEFENVEELPVVRVKSNVGKTINGVKIKNSGRRSIGFGKVKAIAPKSDLQRLRDSAMDLFDRKSGLIDDRKYRRMENEIRTGQTKTVQKVIDELNALGKK